MEPPNALSSVENSDLRISYDSARCWVTAGDHWDLACPPHMTNFTWFIFVLNGLAQDNEMDVAIARLLLLRHPIGKCKESS